MCLCFTVFNCIRLPAARLLAGKSDHDNEFERVHVPARESVQLTAQPQVYYFLPQTQGTPRYYQQEYDIQIAMY